MTEDIKVLENGIIEKLPQIPFVIDQVGYAMDWARTEYDEGAYYKNIKFTLDVADYTSKISQPNFFKTYLIIAALLIDIENPTENPKFEIFQSASHSVENAVKDIRVNPSLSEERGCFKAFTMHAVNLAKTNQEYFAVLLLSILHDLQDIAQGMKEANVKAPVTPADYIKILGYAFTLTNIRMSKLNLLNEVREILNKIDIVLNNDFNF